MKEEIFKAKPIENTKILSRLSGEVVIKSRIDKPLITGATAGSSVIQQSRQKVHENKNLFQGVEV